MLTFSRRNFAAAALALAACALVAHASAIKGHSAAHDSGRTMKSAGVEAAAKQPAAVAAPILESSRKVFNDESIRRLTQPAAAEASRPAAVAAGAPVVEAPKPALVAAVEPAAKLAAPAVESAKPEAKPAAAAEKVAEPSVAAVAAAAPVAAAAAEPAKPAVVAARKEIVAAADEHSQVAVPAAHAPVAVAPASPAKPEAKLAAPVVEPLKAAAAAAPAADKVAEPKVAAAAVAIESAKPAVVVARKETVAAADEHSQVAGDKCRPPMLCGQPAVVEPAHAPVAPVLGAKETPAVHSLPVAQALVMPAADAQAVKAAEPVESVAPVVVAPAAVAAPVAAPVAEPVAPVAPVAQVAQVAPVAELPKPSVVVAHAVVAANVPVAGVAASPDSPLSGKKDQSAAAAADEHIETPEPDAQLVLSQPIDSTTKLLIDLDEHVQKFLPAEDKQDAAAHAKEHAKDELVAGIDYALASAAAALPTGKSSAASQYSVSSNAVVVSGVDAEPIVPPLPASIESVEKASAAAGPAAGVGSAASAAAIPSASSARQGGNNHQGQNQQQVITQLLDQLDALQARIQDTINQLVARRRYVMSALLRPMGTYVRRVRTNLERLQTRVNQLQAAASSVGGGQGGQRPNGFVDAAAIETIRRRIDDISKRISDIVNRIRFSLTPTSAPLNNGRK